MDLIAAKYIAEYFLKISKPEEGDIISNLKLQKLVYYAQGLHLAMFNLKPFFRENILAWEHGPVVEELYHEYKKYSDQAIPQPDEINTEVFNPEQIGLLDEIYNVYGQFSAWKLRQMTHNEPPFQRTNQNEIISHQLMADYFITQITPDGNTG